MPSHAGRFVSAYLLIPRERAETSLPAMVCFHQCNVDCILAKDAVVGKTGEATLDQRYGLELVKSARIEPPWDLDDPRKTTKLPESPSACAPAPEDGAVPESKCLDPPRGAVASDPPEYGRSSIRDRSRHGRNRLHREHQTHDNAF